MADASRQEKLAAARKKLKQFQQQKTSGKTPSNSPTASKPRSSNKTKKNKSNSKKNTVNNDSDRALSPETTTSATTNCTEPLQPPISSDTSRDDSLNVSSPSNPVPERPMSSTESLRQISRQLNGLMSEASFLNSMDDPVIDEDAGIRELESRNRELASALETNVQTNQQLTLQHEELKSQYRKVQELLDKERVEHESKMLKEIGALKEQLQVHIQTIGILVSEKSELQTSLNHSQMTLKQKLDEVDNLSTRLQASRHRTAELERDLASRTNSSNLYEKTSKEFERSRDQLKMDVYNLRRANDDLAQQSSELSSQLQAKISESNRLEDAVRVLQEKVNMSELMVQQLSSTGSESQQMLQHLQDEKRAMTEKMQMYQQSFQQLSLERESLTTQYQQDTGHLQQQIQRLATQVQSLIAERDDVSKQRTRLENRLKETEERLASDTEKSLSAYREDMNNKLDQLEEEKQHILTQYKAQMNDNAQLAKLYQEKEEKLEELENSVVRLKEEAGDKSKLLESMQNDKATISRALSQNKELKYQLAELQNGFVKLSNDNMDMTNKFDSEQHVTKELATRLSQQEDELNDVRDELRSNEKLLEETRAQNFELNKQLAQQSQLTDHMRHYEAQGQLTETLQRELASAQDTINILSSQNSELRVQLAALENQLTRQASNQDAAGDAGVNNKDMVDMLSSSIRQLEMEREQQAKEIAEQHEQYQSLLEQMEVIKKEQASAPAITPEGNFITKEAYETLQVAMEKLEDKFTKVMRDKAELSDKSQELEHVCMQLEGETDTIGDYISLYHEQREKLNQKQTEKEEYVSRLAKEKEEMQRKLGQLQSLVMQLLGEKQYLHPYSRTNNKLGQMLPDTTIPTLAQTTPNQNKTFGSNLDSTHLDDYDWPSSDTESMSSDEVEITGNHVAPLTPNSTSTPSKYVPQGERTAKQIMELLELMGSPNSIDKHSLLDHAFYPCRCCSGELITL